jgi:hypothetical protein
MLDFPQLRRHAETVFHCIVTVEVEMGEHAE